MKNNLVQLMALKGFSINDLADASGYSRNTISNIKSLKNDPLGSTIIEICEALDVTPNEYFGYETSSDLETRVKHLEELTSDLEHKK